jgi:hypothetical protein
MVPDHGKRGGVFELQGLLLVGRRHRNFLVQTAHELAARRRVDAARKLREPLVRLLPEGDPVGHRCRHQDRAKTSNMLLADLAISPPRLDDAGLQPMPALVAKSNKHGSGTMAGPFDLHKQIALQRRNAVDPPSRGKGYPAAEQQHPHRQASRTPAGDRRPDGAAVVEAAGWLRPQNGVRLFLA